MPGDPAAAAFVYDDIRNFLSAFDRIQAGANPREALELEYFARATPGLKALSARKGVSAATMAKSVRRQASDYRWLSNLAAQLIRHEPAMRKAVRIALREGSLTHARAPIRMP